MTPESPPVSELADEIERKVRRCDVLCEDMNRLERKFAAGIATNAQCNEATQMYHAARTMLGETLLNCSGPILAALREAEAELKIQDSANEILTRELEAKAKDAARYMWLWQQTVDTFLGTERAIYIAGVRASRDGINAAIDAALERGAKG